MSAHNYLIPSFTNWPVSINDATPQDAGVMSAADKAKLDSLTPGGGGLTVTSIKTANYTAAAGQMVRCDPAGGTFTVSLPAAPSTNDIVGVKNLTTDVATLFSITIDGNGNNIDGAATTAIMTPWQSLQFMFDGTNWMVI